MKVVIRGVRSQSGFGVATIGLIKLCINAGYDTRFIPLDQNKWHDKIGINNNTLDFLDNISITNDSSFITDSIFIDVGSLIYVSSCIKPNNIKKYICYTTTETTTINWHYIETFNSKFDEIWTASKFNKVSIGNQKLNIPIKILPHLVDTDKFNPDLKPYKIKNKRSFNYVINIDFSYRKGLHHLIPAWLKAFNKNDDVSLIMKISDGDFTDPSAPIKSLNNLIYKYNYNMINSAPILIIPHMIDEQYIPNLYTTGDVFILPTLGEGFGFPIAESMACGIPPITSYCSAPSEYIDNECAFPIHLNENEPVQLITDLSLLHRDINYTGRYIYNISEESLVNNLRTSYTMSKDLLKQKGKNAREKIINNFSLPVLTNTLTQLIEG